MQYPGSVALVVVVNVDTHIQSIVLAADETTVTQRGSHLPINDMLGHKSLITYLVPGTVYNSEFTQKLIASPQNTIQFSALMFVSTLEYATSLRFIWKTSLEQAKPLPLSKLILLASNASEDNPSEHKLPKAYLRGKVIIHFDLPASVWVVHLFGGCLVNRLSDLSTPTTGIK